MNVLSFARLRPVFLVLSTIPLFFLYCIVSSNYQFIKPEYQDKRHFKATVLALPLSNKLLSQEEQVKLLNNKDGDPLKISQNELSYFNNYMGPLLAEKTTASILGIDPFFKVTNVSLAYQNLSPDNKTIFNMFTPTSGQVEYRNTVPDYVLFFEDLYFNKDYVEIGASSSYGRGSSERYTIIASIEYLLWDNRNQNVAAYGKLSKKRSLFLPAEKENYLEILEFFALSIILKSPLVRRM